VNKIRISKDPGIPQETMKDITREIAGSSKQNFIILHTNTGEQRFDFVIDSYYMLKRLEEVITGWSEKGILIERVY
jgi:hypothetical protein